MPFFELDPEDFNFTWFRIEERDFDVIEVSTCWNGSISEISVLGVGLEQVENSLHFAISASEFENGGYIICVVNNTDYGICSSNYTIIFGKRQDFCKILLLSFYDLTYLEGSFVYDIIVIVIIYW